MSNSPNTRTSLSTKKALEKLVDISGVIERRMGVTKTEKNRANDAFRLLTYGITPGTVRQEPYFDFLQRVKELVGNTGVTLCAVGLGQSAVRNMKDRVRVDLPYALKEAKEILQNEYLRRTTDLCLGVVEANDGSHSQAHDETLQHPQAHHVAVDREPHEAASDYLTGDVYELNIDDILKVAHSNEITGTILLTDTYKVNTTSFVTIPISEELTNQLIRQRPRFM